MNLILSIPLEVRLIVVFLAGTCLGSAANWAIYGLAWNARAISPWSRRDPSAPPRHFWDRLPVLGWLGLRREAALWGSGFWLRPMLLELLVGIGIAWLYWWETAAFGLLLPRAFAQPGAVRAAGISILHLEFASHCILVALLLAGAMIDVDEKIIPDAITIPGTLLGLVIAAAMPWTLLPDIVPPGSLYFLNLASPNEWPGWLGGFPQWSSLAVALGCWWLWNAALLPRTWYWRHGLWRAVQLCCARVAREAVTYRILGMAAIGSLAIAAVWHHGGQGWQGLISALVGMAVGGGLVWLVRIIGSAAMRREAMGFGDVTLMAMIGAFLGWQPCIVIFFLAPFAAIVVGLLRLAILRDHEIPYGPFLCLATLFLIVRWHAVWDFTQGVFGLGWIVGLLLLGCLALMGLMLAAWRLMCRLMLSFFCRRS